MPSLVISHDILHIIGIMFMPFIIIGICIMPFIMFMGMPFIIPMWPMWPMWFIMPFIIGIMPPIIGIGIIIGMPFIGMFMFIGIEWFIIIGIAFITASPRFDLSRT